MPERQPVTMTALRGTLQSMMQSRGVGILKDSTKKTHIRRKLESELENFINRFTAANGQLVLVPDSVILQDVLLDNQSLTKELKVWKMKSTSMDKIIDQTSLQIRSSIKQDMQSTQRRSQVSLVGGGADRIPGGE